MDFGLETETGQPIRTKDDHLYEVCQRKSGSLKGLEIHGRVCTKKQKQCGQSGRKMRSHTAQEDKYSGELDATVGASNTTQSNVEPIADRKPKILWPKANDKRRLLQARC